MKNVFHKMMLLAAMCAVLIFSSGARAQETSQTITSTQSQVHFLELYTSQGCSSCPPAEEWLQGLTTDERLWKEIVPVAFHVDYWDYLGWDDTFGDAQFSQRQRNYAAAWKNDRVYTPGFVLDGQEWRGWRAGQTVGVTKTTPVGKLQIELSAGSAEITFEAAGEALEIVGKLQVRVALLGFGLPVSITAGENKGRELPHDFVALDYHERRLRARDGIVRARAKLRTSSEAKRYAIVAWVVSTESPRPLQAVGGWLDDGVVSGVKVAAASEGKKVNKVVKSEEEWRGLLTEDEYRVARQKGTERAFSGKYWDNHETGVYLCVACGFPVFSSDTKFESGSGWPSFWEPLEGEAVKEESDNAYGMVRTEILCGRCDSHLGHVFEDGPRPTGMRYCINSIALKFVLKDAEKAGKKD